MRASACMYSVHGGRRQAYMRRVLVQCTAAAGRAAGTHTTGGWASGGQQHSACRAVHRVRRDQGLQSSRMYGGGLHVYDVQ